MSETWNTDEEIQRFREYLKIPSVHPDVDYNECVEYLSKQAKSLELPVSVHEFVPKKPVVVITWQGTQPRLPAILLNSHMDVVPVYEEFWTYPPFEATISKDGFIYARGTQDMKSIGMMHLEAVRRLKNAGVILKRTVHISFVPDEEIGGIDGMMKFTETEEFRTLNIGFGLDESIGSVVPNEIIMFNAERVSRQIKVTCKGEPGHGSMLHSGTAGEKLHYIINKFMSFRAEELRKLRTSNVWFGDLTTVNLTIVEGGVQVNVLPENLSASFDIRIAPEIDLDEFDNMISTWCKEAGEGVTYEYYVKNPQVKSTKIDGSVPFCTALCRTVEEMGHKIDSKTCPGATDARYVRLQGIPVLGFSPITDTPQLLHAHDERIHVDAYKRGIDIMEKVVAAVANV